ncbi:YihY/virulence factor BrkB family protein [Roseomonas sp. OT10]|uniref:YihY/virulence factor BrkB family protein n=1 Tax=Roseomonas cutis TaxID=2897332 RepID=UPI001E2D373A|nr:YihY/virulence factor BrkB family protein [Roseomonas sp. OT10]UFN49668.1 YihY/virulence factor BrkB family protein [Roseomonas sp. OT10]
MLGRAWDLLKGSVLSFIADDAMTRGAAIAFYTIFSLAPVLVIAVAIAGYAFGTETAQEAVTEQVADFMGPQVSELIGSMLRSASNFGTGLTATVISLVTILVTATAMFGAVESALNMILRVDPPRSSVWAALRARVLGLALVISVGLLLVALLVINAVLDSVRTYIDLLPHTQEWVWLINVGISFLLMVAGIAVLYRVLPNRWLDWREVAMGAVVTALLMVAGRYGISLYMTRAGVASSYGAAGTVFVALLWIYYSALIFLFGAEVTRVYAEMRGHWRPVQKEAAAPAE